MKDCRDGSSKKILQAFTQGIKKVKTTTSMKLQQVICVATLETNRKMISIAMDYGHALPMGGAMESQGLDNQARTKKQMIFDSK